jgi:histone deacetylase 11
MKLPIVFHPDYDISLFGLENLHPFDSKKYGRVFRQLQAWQIIVGDGYHRPVAMASDDLLLRVHTPDYLDSLRQSSVIARIAEMPILRRIPNFILQSRFLNPMRWATAGSILGAGLAMQHGWAVNLGGGYHHAKSDRSSGFCFFADINLAAQHLFASYSQVRKIMVIDLDAHQGNGFEDIFKEDQRVDTFDLYNGEIYPHDLAAARYIRWKFPVKSGTADQQYLDILHGRLGNAITASAPDFIIYNAGTDPYEWDPLGGLGVTSTGLIHRDAYVFKQARSRRIPILMVLSGGYHADSAGIISSSIHHLWVNGLLVDQNLIAG